MYERQRIVIRFAHRTFAWASEARGKAHVHVVIIGFAAGDAAGKQIYDYAGDSVTVTPAGNISPYLVEGPNIAVTNRTHPLCAVPAMGIGNKPIDGGNYLFTPAEKSEFLREEPAAAAYFRRWIGSEEFINGIERWCLWLGDCPSAQLERMPLAYARVQAVRKFRLNSKSPPTQKLAATPTHFHVENFPTHPYLVIPKVSSERRAYIPIGFIKPEVLSSDLLQVLPDATLYHFGVLTSAMHMAWVRQVCGRLKSDYRYSNRLVYNNYPWPVLPTERQLARIKECAEKVLALRVHFGDGRLGFLPARKSVGEPATLANLYDPITMPRDLVRAHTALDRAVERCYRTEPFHSDRERVEHLFRLYEQLTAPLLPVAPRRGGRGPAATASRKSSSASGEMPGLTSASRPGG